MSQTTRSSNKSLVNSSNLTSKDKAYTLATHKRFIRKLNLGKVSIHKLRLTFELAVKSLKADLAKLTEKQLLRRCYFIPTRWDVLEQAYELCLMRLALGRTITQLIYKGESFVDAVRRELHAITDEEIQQRATRLHLLNQARKKALSNPQTKEEFEFFIYRRGKSKLSLEQKLVWEKLQAPQS